MKDVPDVTAKLGYTVNETAKLISLGRNRTFDLIHAGRLRAVRVGKRFIVPRKAIEDFLADGGSK